MRLKWLTFLLLGLSATTIADDFDVLFADDAFADVEVSTQTLDSNWHWRNRLD